MGTRLGLRLTDAGHEVFALRRNARDLPKRLNPISADLATASTLTSLPSGLTHLAYTAAADERTDAAYERAYVRGLKNVLASVRSEPALQRVVFISSTAVYAQDDDSWVTEQSVTDPRTFAGQRTLEAEAVLAQSGIDHCILRCGGIYGEGRTRLIDQVRQGLATYDPKKHQYTNRIHSDDVARALALLLLAPDATGIYNGVDEEPARRRDVLHWLSQELEVPPPSPDSVSNSSRGAGSKRVSCERLRALGFEFRYPSFREGYRALLADNA